MLPDNYDPVTLYHWLWWKLRCFEASGEEFQKLFEETMVRTDDDFARIRPYGNVGDKKSDGVLVGGTVYQVYSPDEYKQAELVNKMTKDLDGAVKHWPQMTRWVFVYNVRRGLPPDVGIELTKAKQRHPKLDLDHMSSDHLWARLRGLGIQKRSEVLGAPPGYEPYFLASAEQAKDLVEKGRFVLIHDLLSPIDHLSALSVIKKNGAEPFGPPLRVKPELGDDWEAAAAFQAELVAGALARSRNLRPRFAVFCMSPIPLAVHLGFLLSDRVKVEVFQWDRDTESWHWNYGTAGGVTVNGAPSSEAQCEEAQIRVSISASIRREDCREAVGEDLLDVELRADAPSEQWLQEPEQVVAVSRAFREALGALRAYAPQLKRIHLFAAVPAGIAVALGRAVNPRMNAPVVLYEYERNRSPRYEAVLTIRS